MKFPLYAPFEYWNASAEERTRHCNGCGSDLDLSGKLVPDTLYGLNIREACCIHDWMYSFGKTAGDKYFSDAVFMMNMASIIVRSSTWVMKILRLLRAAKFYSAVVLHGEASFFHGKPMNDSIEITFKGRFR
jgi:hypothetical protein